MKALFILVSMGLFGSLANAQCLEFSNSQQAHIICESISVSQMQSNSDQSNLKVQFKDGFSILASSNDLLSKGFSYEMAARTEATLSKKEEALVSQVMEFAKKSGLEDNFSLLMDAFEVVPANVSLSPLEANLLSGEVPWPVRGGDDKTSNDSDSADQ